MYFQNSFPFSHKTILPGGLQGEKIAPDFHKFSLLLNLAFRAFSFLEIQKSIAGYELLITLITYRAVNAEISVYACTTVLIIRIVSYA